MIENPRPLARALTICVTLALLTLIASAATGETRGRSRHNEHVALSAGVSELLVLGPVSGDASTTLGVSASGPLQGAWWWTGGARVTLGPVLPEAFARLSAVTGGGVWRPSAGIELGLSARAAHDGGDALLAELRKLSREGVSPVYVAFHASPLRFAVFERYRVTTLELSLGTHVAPFGRFTRVEIGLLSLGIAL